MSYCFSADHSSFPLTQSASSTNNSPGILAPFIQFPTTAREPLPIALCRSVQGTPSNDGASIHGNRIETQAAGAPEPGFNQYVTCVCFNSVP